MAAIILDDFARVDGVVVHPDPETNDLIKLVVLGHSIYTIPAMLMKIESEPVFFEPHCTLKDGKMWYFSDGVWKKEPRQKAFMSLLTNPDGAFQHFAHSTLELYRQRLDVLPHARDACKAASKIIESTPIFAKRCAAWHKHGVHNDRTKSWFESVFDSASDVANFKNNATLDLTNMVSRYSKPSDGFCVTLPYDFSHDLLFPSSVDREIWEFLLAITNNDRGVVEYLLDFLSMCINFSSKPDKFTLFIAGHAKTSGKHLLLRLIRNALGDMAMSFPGELLRHSKRTRGDGVTTLLNMIANSHAALAIGEGFQSKWTIGQGTLLELATKDTMPRRDPRKAPVNMRMAKYKTLVSVDDDGPLKIKSVDGTDTVFRRVAVIHLDRVIITGSGGTPTATNEIRLADDIEDKVASSEWGMALLGLLIRRFRSITDEPRTFATDHSCCAMGVLRATMRLLPQYEPTKEHLKDLRGAKTSASG